MKLHRVTTFEVRTHVLDFNETWGRRSKEKCLWIDGEQIANALGLLDFSEGHMVQLIVCETCGVTGCRTGSWASLRSIDNQIAIIPAFDAMRKSEEACWEYSPPSFMYSLGFPLFSENTYGQFCKSAKQFPAFEAIQRLSAVEVLGLLQFSAPGQILGTLGSPAVVSADRILAVTTGDLEGEIEKLRQVISLTEIGDDVPYSSHPDSVVEFHIDMPSYPTWRPIGYLDDTPVFNLSALRT